MTVSLGHRGVTGVLLDIEGTTTPIAFVHEVLFPFARRNLPGFLERHHGTALVAEVFGTLAAEHAAERDGADPPPAWDGSGPDATFTSVLRYVEWLMERDRKSPGLKRLQGEIWDEGYRRGELRGLVFDDVAPAFRRWRARGIALSIYSSGSELAQRRLFESVEAGELSSLVDHFFDTRVGPKVEPGSYRRIADEWGRPPGAILFVSDVTAELRAARAAGLHAALAERPGNQPQADAEAFDRIGSFEDIVE